MAYFVKCLLSVHSFLHIRLLVELPQLETPIHDKDKRQTPAAG